MYADIFVLCVFGLIGWGIYAYIRGKVKTGKKWNELPLDGPIKVNILERDYPAKGIGSKDFKKTLEIDVTIPQNAWKAIKQAGIMDAIIFEYDLSGGGHYEFTTADFKEKRNVPFRNVNDMMEAKEKLIEALHNIRGYIDKEKAGPQKEQFEV